MKSISIIGKVSGNIYSRQFESGAVQARVPVTVKETWKLQDGTEAGQETKFSVEVWNKTAIFCANRFSDGNAIYVDGDLNMVTYNRTSDGEFDGRLVIAARKVKPLGDTDEANILFRGIGNLTRDPEMRYTNEAGLPVTDVGIAFNRRYLDSSGERQEETLFAELTAWNGVAENLDQYMSKGGRIYVEADKLSLTFYPKNEGGTGAKTEITAKYVQFLSGARAEDQGGPAGAPVDGGEAQGQDDQPW